MVKSPLTALVVGATGNTGKHVVQYLLDGGHTVKVVARSADKMKRLLKEKDYGDRLQVAEAAILDLSVVETEKLAAGCDAVLSCLGHSVDMKGLFGRKVRRLVCDSVMKLTKAMQAVGKPTCRFILMGSEGVAFTGDDQRPAGERFIIFLLRHLMNPHADNEQAAAYLAENTAFDWAVVRPTDLKDDDVSEYKVFPKPQGSLFGADIVARASVAKFMTELVLDDKVWNLWKHKMPVIHDVVNDDPKKTD